jgi:hypothetical protein
VRILLVAIAPVASNANCRLIAGQGSADLLAHTLLLGKVHRNFRYCRVDQNGTGASGPRGGRTRDFVNFRKKIHASRARGAAPRV